jgi:putative transcriptional regulator
MADDFDRLDNPEWNDTNTRSADSAAKLKGARAALLMNQKDFADLLGIPAATLQNWEQRRTEPDAIARTLIDLVFEDPHEMRRRMANRRAA